jgi:hypothetical protein
VLSRDIMTIPEDEILATDVVYTIVGGKIAFDRTRGDWPRTGSACADQTLRGLPVCQTAPR